MTPRGLARIAAASLAPAAGAVRPPLPDHRIRPGIGAGGVRLGMSEGQVLMVLGQPDARHPRSTGDGAVIDLAWPGITVRRWDGPGGRVLQVEITDRGIRLDNGIGVGSTRSAIRAAFPGSRCDGARSLCTVDEDVPDGSVLTIRLGQADRVTGISVARVLD